MDPDTSIDNLMIDKKKNRVLVSINPNIYPLDVVYSACYSLIDRAFIIIDGHPAEEIIVELRPKKKMNLEKLGRLLNEELLSYAFYKSKARQNKTLREILMKTAFLANVAGSQADELSTDKKEVEYVDDPLGIAKPWSETRGRGSRHEESNERRRRDVRGC